MERRRDRGIILPVNVRGEELVLFFFIGDLEFDGEERGFLLVFGGWAEE